MKDWIMELCPEIAEWQAELIAEQAEKEVAAAVAAEREKCSKTKAASPRKLKPVGTGALLHMQQDHFERGWREGAKSVREAIRARGETK